MKLQIIECVKDDYSEQLGPSTVTHAFLSVDGMLFELGRFYEGPYMNDETSKRVSKVRELKRFLEEK